MIVYFLFAHLLGDFFFQTNWAATNKSHNWLALGQHIIYYSLTLLVATTLLTGFSPLWALAFVFINGGMHFVIDAITSRLTTRFWIAGMAEYPQKANLRDFFHVGTDRFLHEIILIGTIPLLLR